MGHKLKALFLKIWVHVPFVCFVIAVLCLCFTYGVTVGKWHVFPYKFLNVGLDSLKEFLGRTSGFRLHPARYEGEGVVKYEPEYAFMGVTLISGAWKDADGWYIGIKLIGLDGEVLHKWHVDPQDVWEKSPHDDILAGPFDGKNTYIHGLLLLPNGDIVFNLEVFGLVKLNSDSEVVWKIPHRTHHSIFEDRGGYYWVCGQEIHESRIPEYVGIKPPFEEEMILQISPEGVIVRKISLLKVIYESGYDGLLHHKTGDILHLNDVEVLSERLAGAFDLFQTGDIMVSMRHINTVFVIDGKTEQIKWSLTHPFLSQHDPDFTEDGYITVFDNHSDYSPGQYRKQGSRIICIEPSTKKFKTLYGWNENQYFFSEIGGMHQHLPNGNMLITESTAARIFEINADGRVVWDWIAPRWKKNKVPEIYDGIRYNAEFANFTSKSRKDKK
jgi:hypothetical protein